MDQLLGSTPFRQDIRGVKFAWWQEPYICKMWIGDMSFHDLWADEVQYLVDCLQFMNCDDSYLPPKPSCQIKDLPPNDKDGTWFFCNHHDNRPDYTFGVGYGEDGEDRWHINYFGFCFELELDEAAELVKQWDEFREAISSTVK